MHLCEDTDCGFALHIFGVAALHPLLGVTDLTSLSQSSPQPLPLPLNPFGFHTPTAPRRISPPLHAALTIPEAICELGLHHC